MSRRSLGLLLGVVAVVAVAATALASGNGNGGGGATAPRIEAYEDAVIGPVQRGGRIVEQGMKPAVHALADGLPSSATMQAITWVDELTAVRSQLSSVKPPAGLEDASKRFDRALALYADAARTIGAAAIADGEPRARLLAEAVSTARHADREYDRASGVLQAARRRADLPPSSRFPERS